jgi:hypothetical protein
MLTFLLIGTAYSEPQANKPYKVCPEVVTAKDTPCRVLGPTVSVVHRDVIKEDPRDKELSELKDRVKQLEEMIRALQSK